MLRKYYKTITVSALALAVPGLTALAEGCDLSDGLATGPVAFSAEANACLDRMEDTQKSAQLESMVRDQSARIRDAAGLAPFGELASLDKAARLHALDMAKRGFAAHEDLEGRTHLDRVRILDRQSLIGAFGASVAVVEDGASASQAFDALVADPMNAANLERTAFDHMGVGVVQDNGRLYVVQLFARQEGQLEAPLPEQLTAHTDLKPVFVENQAKAINWSVVTNNGETIAKGLGKKIAPSSLNGEDGYVDIEMELGTDVYTVKGPAVSMF